MAGGLKPGPHLSLKVADTGAGMPPAVLEKIKALPAGKTVTLNNGQVWKSVNGKATRVR